MDRQDHSQVVVYIAQGNREDWRAVECETIESGKGVQVLDKSVYTGTFITAAIPKKQQKGASSWVKDFFKWLYSIVFTRTKSCCFLALTKPVIENKFKILVILTDVKQSDSILEKWREENYITQKSQKTSGYLCRPGKVFGASIDCTGPNTVLGTSSLELCYYSGAESRQEFLVTGHEHDLVIIFISKHEKQKSDGTNVRRDVLTQMHVELLKKVKEDLEPRVTHQFDEYPDDSFLSWLADEIGHEWAMIGIGLGLKYSYLDMIERDNTPRKTNLTMLYSWREDNDSSADLGMTCLLQSLTITGRRDLVTNINSQVEELMKKSPSTRLCKWVKSRQDLQQIHELDDVDGATRKECKSKGFCVCCLTDNSKAVSPFDDRFLLAIVKITQFHACLLLQLRVPQDCIEDIKHRVSDSSAAMFKCLIIAKRDYLYESTFYDKMLNALKLERNNQAVSEIKELCLKWLRTQSGSSDYSTKKLQEILREY